MGFFDFFKAKKRSILPNSANLWESGGFFLHVSGDPVKSTAVYACARSISFTISRLKAFELKTSPSGEKKKILYSEILDCWNRQPNQRQTAVTFKNMLLSSLVLRGNAYALIGRNQYTKKLELTAIHPDLISVSVVKDDDGFYTPIYFFNSKQIQSSSILHVIAFPDHTGVKGMSAIENFRKTIGIGLQAENYGFNFFKNNATPSTVISYPQGVVVDKTIKNALLSEFNRIFSGSDNSGKTALLADGAKIDQISLSNEDSQFIQTREFQVKDIARIFGVPPHKIGDLMHATYSNMEQQNLDYVQDAIVPYVEMIESAIESKFFFDPSHEFEINVEGLLRGDLQSRTAAYIAGSQNGWLSPNEIRQMEGGLDPYEGGDAFYRPMNLGKVAPSGNLTTPEDSNQNEKPKESEAKE